MQHFEGYDPEGFSIWFLDYKYPEENTVNFIVMNKVSRPTNFIFSFNILQRFESRVVSIFTSRIHDEFFQGMVRLKSPVVCRSVASCRG